MSKLNSFLKSSKIIRFGLPLLIVVILGFLVFAYVNRDQKTQQPKYKYDISYTETQEKLSNQTYLDNKDYERYQYAVTSYADVYFSKKDYKNALRIYDMVLKNVPKSKIIVSTYEGLSEVYKATGDDQNYAKYTNLLIEEYKQQGQTDQANYYQGQLIAAKKN